MAYHLDSGWFSLYVVVFVGMLGGCATWAPLNVPSDNIAKTYLEYEKGQIRQRQNDSKACLALSGGGPRAMAHSIGVLRALYERHDLHNLTYISAVSGGSYASGWLYTQLLQSSTHNLSEPFSNSSLMLVAQQGYVLKISDVVELWLTRAWRRMIRGGGIISGLPYLSYNLAWPNLARIGPVGPGGWRSSVGAQYEKDITRILRSDNLQQPKQEIHPLPISNLASLIIQQKLPTPIFNASVGGKLTDEEHQDDAQLFEFTPFGMGSPITGYHQYDQLPEEYRNWPLERSVAISAAVIDSKGQVAAKWGLGNIDFGYELLNFAALPDSNNQYYVVLDGGNTENLGVAALVKRSCSEITIVDSEEDQGYAYEAYVKFKQIIAPALGVRICVPKIDKALWPKQETQDCVSPEVGQKFQPLPAIDQSTEAKTKRKENFATEPVMMGSLYYHRSSKGSETYPGQATIRYIKLAADSMLLEDKNRRPDALLRYGKTLVTFYANHQNESFPQYKTLTNPRWPSDRFHAVMNLGYCNTWWSFDSTKPCKPDPEDFEVISTPYKSHSLKLRDTIGEQR